MLDSLRGFLYVAPATAAAARRDPNSQWQTRTGYSARFAHRVDTSGEAKQYGIPAGNPSRWWRAESPESWSAHPWRWSFDRGNRRHWIVTWPEPWEELDAIPAAQLAAD